MDVGPDTLSRWHGFLGTKGFFAVVSAILLAIGAGAYFIHEYKQAEVDVLQSRIAVLEANLNDKNRASNVSLDNKQSEIDLLKERMRDLEEKIGNQQSLIAAHERANLGTKSQLENLKIGVDQTHDRAISSANKLASMESTVSKIEEKVETLERYGAVVGGVDPTRKLPKTRVQIRRGQAWEILDGRAHVLLHYVWDAQVRLRFKGFDNVSGSDWTLRVRETIDLPFRDRNFRLRVIGISLQDQSLTFEFEEIA